VFWLLFLRLTPLPHSILSAHYYQEMDAFDRTWTLYTTYYNPRSQALFTQWCLTHSVSLLATHCLLSESYSEHGACHHPKCTGDSALPYAVCHRQVSQHGGTLSHLKSSRLEASDCSWGTIKLALGRWRMLDNDRHHHHHTHHLTTTSEHP